MTWIVLDAKALVIEFGSSPASPRKQSSLVLTEAVGKAAPVPVADAHCPRAAAAPHCSAVGRGEEREQNVQQRSRACLSSTLPVSSWKGKATVLF